MKLVYKDVPDPEVKEDEILLEVKAAGPQSRRLDLINTDIILSAEAHLSEGAVWLNRLYNKERGLTKVLLIP